MWYGEKTHLGFCICQCGYNGRFSNIGDPDNDNLSCPLAFDVVGCDPFCRTFFLLGLGLMLCYAFAQIGPELIRALVLGHDRKHLFQGFYFLIRTFSLPVALFGFKVGRRQIGPHVPFPLHWPC